MDLWEIPGAGAASPHSGCTSSVHGQWHCWRLSFCPSGCRPSHCHLHCSHLRSCRWGLLVYLQRSTSLQLFAVLLLWLFACICNALPHCSYLQCCCSGSLCASVMHYLTAAIWVLIALAPCTSVMHYLTAAIFGLVDGTPCTSVMHYLTAAICGLVGGASLHFCHALQPFGVV